MVTQGNSMDMGHQNIQFMRHMMNLEADQGPGPRLPDPYILYSSVANFPQPNLQPVAPTPGSRCNYNIRHTEHHDNAVFYSMPPYNGIQPQYNPYLAPPSGTRDFPLQVNYRALDPFSPFATHRIVGIPSMDGVRESFKRKNSEGVQCQNASAGPSSSVATISARPSESDIMQDNAASYLPLDYRRQGNYIAPPVPWSDSNISVNNGEIGLFPWPNCNIPYRHASSNGVCDEGDVQGYQMRTINRRPAGLMHPPYAQQGHSNHHHPNQPVQVPRFGPTFMGPAPPTGFRLYGPHRFNPNLRHCNLPHLRVLPEDEVAILEIPGYHEVGDTVDHHRDLRLDIDQMSYEELLALGEHIGCVGTGLSEEFIQNNLKVRTLALLPAHINLEVSNDQQRISFCVVCQSDYKSEEKIGTLECGHEYHSECIKKWLVMKNTCPVCKSPALRV